MRLLFIASGPAGSRRGLWELLLVVLLLPTRWGHLTALPCKITTSLRVIFFGDGSGVVEEMGQGYLDLGIEGGQKSIHWVETGDHPGCRKSGVQY